MKEPNRRRVPRRTYETSVGLLISGEYKVARAYQVGEGGMLVATTQNLVIGQSVVVSFYLRQTMIIARATVRNHVPAKGSVPARFGVEFSNLEFQFRREIRNFVASSGQSDEAFH